MLRADLNIPIVYRRTLEWGGTYIAQKPRGKITIDSVDVASRFADNILVGSARSVPVYRDAALNDDKFVYKDTANVTIDTN